MRKKKKWHVRESNRNFITSMKWLDLRVIDHIENYSPFCLKGLRMIMAIQFGSSYNHISSAPKDGIVERIIISPHEAPNNQTTRPMNAWNLVRHLAVFTEQNLLLFMCLLVSCAVGRPFILVRQNLQFHKIDNFKLIWVQFRLASIQCQMAQFLKGNQIPTMSVLSICWLDLWVSTCEALLIFDHHESQNTNIA